MLPVFRAVLGYCFLVFVIRIVGGRPGKQMTPFEYVLIFFIGGLMLTTLIGDDRSVTNALGTIMAVAATHLAPAWLKQVSPSVSQVIDGRPLVLLSKGEFKVRVMTNAGIADDDIMAAARDKGLKDFGQVGYAVLERNGEISIVPKERE